MIAEGAGQARSELRSPSRLKAGCGQDCPPSKRPKSRDRPGGLSYWIVTASPDWVCRLPTVAIMAASPLGKLLGTITFN